VVDDRVAAPLAAGAFGPRHPPLIAGDVQTMDTSDELREPPVPVTVWLLLGSSPQGSRPSS
jgi:hypothetical protein